MDSNIKWSGFYTTQHGAVFAKPEDFLTINRVYAHGELEELLGYDILCTTSISTYNKMLRINNGNPETIFNDIAIDAFGKTHPVKVFAWMSIHGNCALVILATDLESEKYVVDRMSARAVVI